MSSWTNCEVQIKWIKKNFFAKQLVECSSTALIEYGGAPSA